MRTINIYSKYAWVVPIKYKRGITITNAFQTFLDESIRKPNKILVDKRIEFYNRSIKSLLQGNGVEMYLTHVGKLEADIKNRAYYFLDDIINIKNYDPNKIKIDEKSYKNISHAIK